MTIERGREALVTRHRYAQPPIVEAVCEFRFEPGDWDNAIPGLIWEQVQKQFPKRRNAARFDLQSVAGPGGLQHRLKQESLIQYLQDDERRFMQVGQDVLTVNHLAPYTSWEEFRPLILEGLEAYRAQAKPKAITRIGLRYINRFELPGDRVELEDILEFRPHIGEKLPKDHASFTVGAEFLFEQNRDVLRLQVASAAPVEQPRLALILDLDYFTLLPDSAISSDIVNWLEVAHGHIEDAFEGSITDTLRRTFAKVDS
jgi:uncharacterized protein (TIGR04255 family)